MRPNPILSLCLVIPVLLLAAAPAGAATPATRKAPAPATATTAHGLPRLHLHGDALAGGERTLSIDELDALTTAVEWTVADPYKRRDNRYRGILLKDFVKTMAPGAQRVRMRAISDSIAVFDRREWETLPILIATRDEGARMMVADKGPARVIYLQTRDNELAMQVHAPKWIWQVIDVEFSAR